MFFRRKKKKIKESIEITDQNFDELILNADVPVLLDLWAPGCPPCTILSPIVDEIAGEFQGRALVGKVNVHQHLKISNLFKIKSIPTLIFIQKDEIAERFTGLIPKPNIVEILEELIAERNA
ncbi:MAG TPA: thiol reductase thioredoxin [Phaeodactylibacter sp.]|nr:thiol reductase thioredoxin [Phaeodactylibacter sp.]